MAIKKSALYSSLWESCDELRGGMDASQYKDYILTLLFVKYVSDKYADKPDSLMEIPNGGAFADLVALKGDKEIGDKINIAIAKLAESNNLSRVIDLADFNDEDKLGKGKEMQDRLSKLVSIFDDLDLSSNTAEGDDLLGDAYEYLMRHFATESGKSKGQFYTPAEVSRIMAKVIGIGKDTRQNQTVYDPTCGSGSLLLKADDEAPNGMSIYGQEKDVSTTALAKMNMVLHGKLTAEIAAGGSSTFSDPDFTLSSSRLKTFDFVVANPPFSTKSWQNGFAKDESTKTIIDPYHRFDYGVPPAKNGDYAFLLHIIHSLKSTGKGAVILPHGVLFRGNVEAAIRKKIVELGYIKSIIGLPANLFYGTGIPACIVVLDKKHSESRKGVFMIDANKGFTKDGNKNRLRDQDIHKIVDVFNHKREIDGFSRLVPVSEIADSKNDYNLNLPRYIDSGDEPDIHDLSAHLKGGIPKRDIDRLQNHWDVFTATRKTLFKQSSDPDYLIAQIPSDQIKTTILDSDEYQDYANKIKSTFIGWKDKYAPYLKSLEQGCKPKDVIWKISEDLLETFVEIPLIDRYDVYQHLMNYWSEVMQDDVYQISSGGWAEAQKLRLIVDEKNKSKKIKETPDIVVGSGRSTKKFKADIIPPVLIVMRYYAEEKQAIDELEAQQETLAQKIEELTKEHSGEEGLLQNINSKKIAEERLREILSGESNEIRCLIEIKRCIDAKEPYQEIIASLSPKIAEMILNKNGSVGKSKITPAIRELQNQILQTIKDEEAVLLKQYIDLYMKQKTLKDRIKAQQLELNKKTVKHYQKLSIDEIKELVVIDKWFTKLSADVGTEIERVTQVLANRVKELEERYAHPMPKLAEKVADYSVKVEEHLKKMGLE